MNDKVVFGLLIFLSTMTSKIMGQADSAHVLSGVTVSASRVTTFSSGVKLIEFDSTSMQQYKNKNLSDLLSDESTISIKTYGQGALATTSFRGGSASQTAILWNGLNINSVSTGQMDLSLIPAGFSNSVAVQYGGVGALWGSGAIGGAIHLNNIPKFNSGLSVSYGIFGGDFHTLGQNINIEYGSKRISSSITFMNKYAGNDFEIQQSSEGNSEIIKQQHAELRSVGFIANSAIKIAKNQQLNLSLWQQKTERNLPPTLLETISEATQEDNALRLSADWQINGRKLITHLRSGYFDEQLHYLDPLSNTDALSLSKSWIVELESKYSFHKNHTINGGINNTYTTAQTSGYSWNPTQNRTSFFAAYQFVNNSKKLNISTSARQEIIPNLTVPFTYSAGIQYQIFPFLATKANMSRLYRLPTFNDLYWTPGGNPDLLPEDGYTEEIGVALNWSNKKNSLHINEEVTLFNRTIDNWIVWMPGTSYWTPQNMLNVWSRGMETHSSIDIKVNKISIQLSVKTSYVLSTNEKSRSVNDNSVDKQMIYVPLYSGNGRLKISYKNVGVTYRHQYTGYRYTSTDNSEYLEPYQLGSVILNYQKQLKKVNLNLFAQADNLWNITYQIMPYRAMPYRNYSFGLNINFKTTQK